jgi:hypothetical protein
LTSLAIAQETVSSIDGSTQTAFYDFTDEVAGTVLTNGDTLSANTDIPINLAIESEYNFVISMTGVTNTGQECTANEVLSFTAGGYDFEFNPDGFCNGDNGKDDKDDKNGGKKNRRFLKDETKSVGVKGM